MAKNKNISELYEKVKQSSLNYQSNKTFSYKEICKLLNETDYSAHSKLNSKKKQLENWSLCFSFDRKGNKFSNIHVLTEDQFFYNILDKKYQNTNIYGMCGLMDMCYKLTGENHLYISKSEIANALGYYNKDFQPARYGNNSLLIEIEEETLNRFGENYSFLKSYKNEIKTNREKNNNSVTITTVNSFKNFAKQKNQNISRQIDTLLNILARESFLLVQPCLIGGFIDDSFLSMKDFDVSLIYKNTAGYYYPIKNNLNKDQKLLISYNDRPLSTPETDVFMIIHDEVMSELKCRSWTDLYAHHKEGKYQSLIFEKCKKELNALFVYFGYKISFSPNMTMLEGKDCKNQDQLFDLDRIVNALFTTNRNSKKTDIDSKQIIIKDSSNRYKIGNSLSEQGQQIKDTSQKINSYLINNFSKKFVDININEYFPISFDIDEIDKYSTLIWPKIINNSKRKSDNYNSIFHESNIFLENKTKQIEKQIENIKDIESLEEQISHP